MSRLRNFLVLFAFLFVGSNVGAQSIKAGVAQADITPPVGYRMAGYFNERLSTGIHDPLFAKAIVLQDSNEKFAWVFTDLVGHSLNISTNARAEASAKTGILVKNIMICSTHSHTGPLFEGVIRDYLHDVAIKKDGKDSREEIDYPKFLINQIVKTIVEANSKLEPVSLNVGIGKLEGVSFNRRYHMKNGRVAFNPGIQNTNIVRPAGPIDPDVSMLMIRRAKDKKLVGGATVFAVHADCIGGTEYSADYPFFLSESLKKKFGSDYISAFGAGTCGDINQINVNSTEPFKGLTAAEKIGTNIAKVVIAEESGLQSITKPSFAARSEKIQVPLKTVTPEKLAEAKEKMKQLTDESASFFMKVEAVRDIDIAGKGGSWPMEVQAFRLDNETAVVALPCEIFVELGLAIKKDSPFEKTTVISICNDRPSYVPTKKAFGEGSYEITNARVAEGAGEMLVETAVKLLKELQPN